MSISAEQIQVLYEMAMSIGTSLDINEMLRSSLPVFLKRLNCSCGGVLHVNKEYGMRFDLKEVYTIPRNAAKNSVYRNALKDLNRQLSDRGIGPYRRKLPLYQKRPGSNFSYIFDLPGFGFLILIKNSTEIDSLIVESLPTLLVKLSAACKACFQDEALRVSEEKFRDLFENANDMIQSVDVDGRFLFVNKKWRRTLRYTDREIRRLSQTDIIKPDMISDYNKVSLNVVRGKSFERIETVFIAKDGREIHVEGNVNSYKKNGRFIASRGIFRDVTERRLTEKALKNSEQKYRSVLEQSADNIFLVEKETGKILEANAALRKFLGYSKKEMKNLSLYDFVAHPRSDIDEIINRIKARSKVFIGERTYRRKDGSLADVEVSASTIEYGKKSAISIVSRDITGRKRAERELQKREMLLRVTQQLTKVGGWEYDVAKDSMSWTDEVYRLHDLPVQPGGRLISHSLNCYREQDRLVILKAFQGAIEKGAPYDLEFPFKTHKGRKLWVRTTGKPIWKNGRVIRVIGNLMDITEMKQAEELIKASLKEKEVMLKEIHHRVKNNMQIMMSLLRLQTAGIADPVMQSMVKDHNNRILTMAMIHQKLYQSDNLARINFADYIQDLASHLLRIFSVPSDKIQVVTELEDIYLDVNQAIPCGLLVNELVSNVLKHAFPDDQTGKLHLGLHKDQSGSTCLVVNDSGIGLSADFNWRESSSLGLHLVEDLARQMNGRVETNFSEGTSFRVIF